MNGMLFDLIERRFGISMF